MNDSKEHRRFVKLIRHIARKRPTLANNATSSHSLRSAGKKSLTSEAVAENVVKPSLGDRATNSLNWNVERMRSTGEPKNEL